MASISATSLILFLALSLSPKIFSATVVQDLINLHPPPDFNTTISNNCKKNPSLRYCNFSPSDLPQIFKFTIVASHLCNESGNPNCVEAFPEINLRNRPKLAPLYLSFSFFWKYCPLTIMSIDLSNNSLRGHFPSEIFHCSQIQSLDLSHNDFSGDVPIQPFSLLTNLSFLNLSYNHFSETNDTQFLKRFNSSSFLHSGLIPDHRNFKIKALLLLIFFPAIVIFTVVCFCWLCFCRPDFLPRVFRREHKFTPSILKAATNGFSKKNLVSRTDSIVIYKGVLRNGNEVRIETYRDDRSWEERMNFAEECKILVQLSHNNLVRILGWCDNRSLRALVTEWVDGESIETWLSRSAPPWKHRVKVMIRIMQAMCYLQEEWPQVGYDLKTSSILLTDGREPQISRFRVEDQNHTKKKVHRFGVLLLEMVVNRRPREEFEGGKEGFVDWVRREYECPEKAWELVDERMKKKTESVSQQAVEAIKVGLMCTDTWLQPSMRQVSDMMAAIYRDSGGRGHSESR
ncbi:Non-specific serine/threonine protein kinase [Bertholletia excelsa]